MQAKYRVFDTFDCIGTFDTLFEAFETLEFMLRNKYIGLQLRYMNDAEFANFIKG